MALNDTQLILLDNLIYLDYTVGDNTDNATVRNKVNYLLSLSDKEFKETVTDEQFYYCKDMVNGMSPEQWRTVLNAIAADETLMSMQITNVKDDNDYTGGKDKSATGFRAACFTNGEDTAVIYRGTVGSNQWDDNGVGGTSTGTVSQLQAYQYLSELQYTDIADTSIYVSGHSKGGNMAQYASLIAMSNTNLNIEQCLSFDGQGFSKQFLDYAQEMGFMTDEALSKIYKISSEYDVVNSLFLPLQSVENTTFIDSSGALNGIADYAMVGHIGSNVLSVNGELNNSTIPRPIHAFMSELMTYMYENVDTETTANICSGLMGLLADNNGEISVILDVLIMNKIPVSNLPTTYMIVPNKYQESISQLFNVFCDFCLEDKNKGLLALTVADYIKSDGIVTNAGLNFLQLLFKKFNIESDDISKANDFYNSYVNDHVSGATISDPSMIYLDYEDALALNLYKKATGNAIETIEEVTEQGVKISLEIFSDFMKTFKFIVDNEHIWKYTTRPVLATANVSTNAASKIKYDPLILDLDGDGFNVETKENGANFDLDKNGFAEKINWTKKDGFLCLDLNGNGTIDNGGELFGDKTLLADGTTAKNGFEALAQYDGNGDGVIDENDEIFGSLRIWVDADGNGISSEGEMKTLAELGISSINLGYENVNSETGTEATIGNTASFTRVDGTTGGIGELWVSSDLFDTVDKLDIEIPDDIKELPNIRSIGNVYSLHNAMALDETGELKALVENFASEQDLDKRMQIAEQILYFVCGANDVADGSRGSYMDAKQLAVIEAMLGENYVGTSGANPHRDAAPMLKEAYADLLNMYFNELNAQTHIKDYAALLRYTENEDGTKTLNADLVNYVLEYQLSHGDEQAKNILGEIARYVQYLDNGGITGINDFVMNYAKISAEYAAEIFKVMPNGFAADGIDPLSGTNSADFLAGSDNGETINGGNGDDVIVGGKGNDTLYGGYGNDTYIFNLGDGNDVINEQNSNSALDKIVFGEGISAEDIIVTRSGNDMVLKIKGTEDSIRIVSQYIDSYYRVESFEFADGTVVSSDTYYNTSLEIKGSGVIEDFTGGYGTRNTTLIGSDEADAIYGYSGNDVLIGGKGNDTLYGGYGNDTYIFNLGDGNDVINEQNSNSASDKLVFGEGISITDIMFSNTGNNMEITFAETADSVTIINQKIDSYYRVENFVTSDGYTIDYSKVNQLIQAMASFEADTGMSWTEAVEQSNETANSIISEMWVKSVS